MNVLGTKESISKSLFADLLSQVWYKIFQKPTSLVDLEQLEFFQLIEINNIKHFDQQLYNRYQYWIE